MQAVRHGLAHSSLASKLMLDLRKLLASLQVLHWPKSARPSSSDAQAFCLQLTASYKLLLQLVISAETRIVEGNAGQAATDTFQVGFPANGGGGVANMQVFCSQAWPNRVMCAEMQPVTGGVHLSSDLASASPEACLGRQAAACTLPFMVPTRTFRPLHVCIHCHLFTLVGGLHKNVSV